MLARFPVEIQVQQPNNNIVAACFFPFDAFVDESNKS
jgi:hypothetical protein